MADIDDYAMRKLLGQSQDLRMAANQLHQEAEKIKGYAKAASVFGMESLEKSLYRVWSGIEKQLLPIERISRELKEQYEKESA